MERKQYNDYLVHDQVYAIHTQILNFSLNVPRQIVSIGWTLYENRSTLYVKWLLPMIIQRDTYASSIDVSPLLASVGQLDNGTLPPEKGNVYPEVVQGCLILVAKEVKAANGRTAREVGPVRGTSKKRVFKMKLLKLLLVLVNTLEVVRIGKGNVDDICACTVNTSHRQGSQIKTIDCVIDARRFKGRVTVAVVIGRAEVGLPVGLHPGPRQLLQALARGHRSGLDF